MTKEEKYRKIFHDRVGYGLMTSVKDLETFLRNVSNPEEYIGLDFKTSGL